MELQKFTDVWPGIYLFDLFRYLIPVSILFIVFWVIGKASFRHLFIQNDFPENRHLLREFIYSMSTVVIFSLIGFLTYSAEKSGLTQIYDNIEEFGILYLVISFILTVVFHDFYFYWTHRLMHLKSIFRYVHRAHHESTNPSPWAAYAFHPWEAIIQALVMPIMVLLFPLHPVVIFLFLTYMIIRNVIGHLGFEIFPKGWTRNKWLSWTTAVTHHNMHHERFHVNYGLYFTWWDKWMKTEDKEYEQKFNEVKSRPKSCELKSRTRKAITTSLILIVCIHVGAQTVEGQWTTYNELTGSPLSIVEIKKSGNSVEGRIIRIFLEPFQGEDPICSKCEGNRKDQKVINMNFAWGFKKDGAVWNDGKIVDPQSGQVYDCKLWLDGSNTITVRGYGGPLNIFYRTQTWKREGFSQNESPVGIWNTIDDTWDQVKSQIEIVENGGELIGYIRKIFLLPHEGTDPLCIECDGELKNQKIVGMRILYGFEFNGKNWENGKIMDPGNGSTYSASMWLTNEGDLKVRGYLGPFFRSQVWRRIKSGA